jgi:hypothetical protein
VLLQKKSNNYTAEDYTIDVAIVMEYFFGIKLYQFFCQAMAQIPSLFMIQSTLTVGIKNSGVSKMWENLIDYFTSNNVFNYCSGEMAITILTFDGLVKNMLNPALTEDHEQIFTKALEIWLRIYRDPRSKYDHFISNSWLVFIIKVLLELKAKNTANPQNNQ